MYKSITLFIFGLVLASGIQNAAAQTTSKVEGTVTTTAGEPASSVVITARGMNRRAITGNDGSYQLKGIPEGDVVLIASRIGLVAQEQRVRVVSGESVRADFVLAETELLSDDITINASRSSNEIPITISKVLIPPMDLPQSMAVIGRNTIENQQALHIGDAVRNVNGVYVMGSTGGTQEELAGRGFAFGSSNTFKNGVRFNNGVMPEMSSLERLEVLKGSNAILFGNVAAGGIINLVTKKPMFQQGGELSVRVGSYSFYKSSIDVYGPLLHSDRVAYRFNATYENANSFRDDVGSERIYINPSLVVKAGDRTEILFEGDYLKDARTIDYGTGAINYSIADVPRNRFLGASWSYNRVNQASATSTFTHHFSDDWNIRAVGAYQSYRSDLFGTTRPNASGQFVRTDGTWTRGVQRSQIDEAYSLGQVDLTARLVSGIVEQKLLIGSDVDRYRTATTAFQNISRYDTINIFDPTAYLQRGDVPQMRVNTLTTSPVDRVGLYVQDHISIGEALKLLVGVRWSYQSTRSEVLFKSNDSTTSTTSSDDAITPRFGIVYRPTRAISLFASYANSFTINTGIDVNGNALSPSYINQYEAGVKSDWLDGMVSANVTAYQIVNSNLAQTSLLNGNTNSNIKELAGEVTSRGIEVDIASREWNGLSLLAGYSYNLTKYTRSNTYIVGSELRYNPSHTANASLWYTVESDSWLDGANLGVGVVYIGDRVAGRSTRLTIPDDSYRLMPVPDYVQVDLMAGYAFNDMSLKMKVSNLFDVLSYNVHDDNSINPIHPRQFSLTTSIRL